MVVYTASAGVFEQGETIIGVFDNEDSACLAADLHDMTDSHYVVVERWDTRKPKLSEQYYYREAKTADELAEFGGEG